MKRIVLFLVITTTTLCGAKDSQPSRIVGYIKQAEKEVKELASDAVFITHEAIVDVETAVIDIPVLIKDYEASLKARYAIERPDSYSAEKAVVTTTLLDEADHIVQRKAHAQKALKKILHDVDPNDYPVVALCGSGGGIRAMYETLGWLLAAEQLGLLDTLIYTSGLSGSTWAFNPWIASGLSVEDYTTKIIPHVSISLGEQIKALTITDLYDLIVVLGRTYYNKRALSFIDVYGALLSHIFFKGFVENPYQYTLTSLKPAIEDGTHPFVISTSVLGANNTVTSTFGHKPTYEFTPFSTGSFEVECFVPMWGLGRTFNNGHSQAIEPPSLFPEASVLLKAAEAVAPTSTHALEELYELIKAYEDKTYYGHEVPLGYLLGICGSAFSTDIFNALLELYQLIRPGAIDPSIQKPLKVVIEVVQDLLEGIIGTLGEKLSKGKLSAQDIKTYLQDHQLAAAHIPNLRYNQSTKAFDQLTDITLVDAGFELMDLDRANLGIEPLLHRDIDLILICDASADHSGAPSLRAAEKQAHILKRPFPKVDYTGIDARHATLIVDHDNLEAPVLVYMPGIPNAEYDAQVGHHVDPDAPYYESQVLKYSKEHAQDLLGLIQYTTKENYSLIKEAYNTAAQRKQLRRNE